jgi:AraC family transcriptional regulator of adaptative response/methylated-DNA-[protein]-cysteine methyltransferase
MKQPTKMEQQGQPSRDYTRIAQAIAFLNEYQRSQPGLEDVAEAAGLSPFHFQRLFRRWAGVSPKQYLQYLTVEHAKTLLSASENVLEASYATGLSGPGRLHDHFVAVNAVTPGEYRTGGAGLTLRWGITDTPYGTALIALSPRGICALSFADGATDETLAELCAAWPNATLKHDMGAAATTGRRIREAWDGNGQILVHLSGTNFQISVWQALLNIPEGQVATYGGLAEAIGRPAASRAVGQAVGRNAIAWLIPCHRVIRSSGAIGGYRWDRVRKQAMLARESARQAARAS